MLLYSMRTSVYYNTCINLKAYIPIHFIPRIITMGAETHMT